MSQIGKPVLRSLNRIYSFIGGLIGVSEIDLRQPIQLVHDVSREAELGGGVGLGAGFMVRTMTLTHAAANTQNLDEEAWTQLEDVLGAAADPTAYQVWLLGVAAQVNTLANLSSLKCVATWPATGGVIPGPGGLAPSLLVFYADSGTACEGAAGATVIIPFDSTGSQTVTTARFPILLPPGGYLATRSISSGALTTTVHFLLWAGPAGARPPGLA